MNVVMMMGMLSKVCPSFSMRNNFVTLPREGPSLQRVLQVQDIELLLLPRSIYVPHIGGHFSLMKYTCSRRVVQITE